MLVHSKQSIFLNYYIMLMHNDSYSIYQTGKTCVLFNIFLSKHFIYLLSVVCYVINTINIDNISTGNINEF